MWTINYLQSDHHSSEDQGRTSEMENDFIFDYRRPRQKLKIKTSVQNIQEIDSVGPIYQQATSTSAKNIRSLRKNMALSSNIHGFSRGRQGHFNSLPQLTVSNNFDFSFQEGANQTPLLNTQAQRGTVIRQQLSRIMLPKLSGLKLCRDQLRAQSLQLKRQIIKFQGFKNVFFEDFARKLRRHVFAFTESAQKERNRLNELLLHYTRDLKHSQQARVYFQQENSKLQLTLIKKQQIIERLTSEVKKLKLDVAQLQEENEEYFNQASSPHANIAKLTQSANQGELLKEQLNKTKEQVKQLESKMGSGLQEAQAFQREVLQYRKEVEAKIKQGWNQLKRGCGWLLPLGEKVREGFSQLEASSRNRSQLAFLKSKVEQKIGTMLAFQGSNYIQLSQLQREDARFKLYTLLNLMNDIKVSVFDQLQQSHGLLDYEKKCRQNMGNLIQHCNKSLDNEQGCGRQPSYSAYTSRKTEARPYTRQMSEFFSKQSIGTVRTAESQSYRMLNNSCSESNIGCSRIQPRQIKRIEIISKMNKSQQRLNTLRREVRQNLKKIT